MKLRVLVAVSLVMSTGTLGAYEASNFATEVVDYDEGAGVGSDWISGDPFNNPDCALGRPTVDTTGDGWYIPFTNPVPVVPVYPSFRAHELVTIGTGGFLTVKFDHRVENDPDNPYGVDLVVFGNAFQVIGGGQGWANGDPNATSVGPTVFKEPGIVSVSQDGQAWHTFAGGPYADDFAPTLGRVYDEGNPDTSIGEWNEWWGEPTDPTKPIDPSLSAAGLDGMTVKEIAILYDGSAGGAGFDIGAFDLDWIQYVRVEDDPESTSTTEIDGFADVASETLPVAGDANGDGKIDGADLAIWQQNYDPLGNNPNTFDMGDFNTNGNIDGGDLALWQQNYDPIGSGSSSANPEPATLLLVGSGLLSLTTCRVRRGMK